MIKQFQSLSSTDSDSTRGRCCLRRLARVLLLLGTVVTPCAGQEIETERSGLVYSIGRIEKVSRGSALMDLGDVHGLTLVSPFNQVAIFRATSSGYIPVGVVRVAETYATFSRTRRTSGVSPEKGDVVMFVRELSQLSDTPVHRDRFIGKQVIRNSNASSYSTFRRPDTARALTDYQFSYPKWERRRARVLGFYNGPSFAEGGEELLSPLLNYIDMLREDYRIGRNSLPAAGTAWDRVMSVLYGETAEAQHQAAQPVAAEDTPLAAAPRPADRDIRRVVRDVFFDRTLEEQNLLAYLVATMLEASPGNQEVWFRQKILSSQFPEMSEEEYVLEQVLLIMRTLQEDL
ncbi:MAG: hypothetical protein RIK87_26705 [Fuerstiella sp.]